MKPLFLAAAFTAALSVPAPAATLLIQVLDNGTSIGFSPISTFGIASFIDNGTLDPNFSSISVTANGPPLLPGGDLTSITADITAAGSFPIAHTLDIRIFQNGVSLPAGTTTESTMTVNNLVGTPGPSTLSTFIDGGAASLGTLLNSATFPPGTVNETQGPFANTLGADVGSDAHQYQISFTAADQAATDSIQLTTEAAIPEASTWSMLLLGVAAIMLTMRKKHGVRFAA